MNTNASIITMSTNPTNQTLICPGKYNENDSTYLTGYTVFVWILSCLIILANVLLIIVILKSKGLRSQVLTFFLSCGPTFKL